jgi:hypothetical protein
MLMKEQDPLHTLLREWEAPEAPPALDARVRDAYRASVQPPWWRQMWSFRVSIPVPVLAAALLLAMVGVWLQTRSGPPVRPAAAPPGYVTRLESAGFQPLPEGATRVIRAGEVKQ